MGLKIFQTIKVCPPEALQGNAEILYFFHNNNYADIVYSCQVASCQFRRDWVED